MCVASVQRLTLLSGVFPVQLHNALLLSILYNTTRPTLPPSAVRHTGWHKRQRDKDGHKIEDRDPKRRKVKALVMALGKKERADVKALALGKKDIDRSAENGGVGSLKAGLDSREAKRGKDGIPLAIQSPASVEGSCLFPPRYSEAVLIESGPLLRPASRVFTLLANATLFGVETATGFGYITRSDEFDILREWAKWGSRFFGSIIRCCCDRGRVVISMNAQFATLLTLVYNDSDASQIYDQ